MNIGSLKAQDVKQLVINAIATVKRQSSEQVMAEIAQHGDLDISAKECMSVGAIIEEQTGCAVLTPIDLATSSTRPLSSSNRKPNGGNGCMDPAEDGTADKLTSIVCRNLGIGNGL